MARQILFSIIVCLILGTALSLSTGPPAETDTCVNLRPAGRSPHVLQSGSGTYNLIINIPTSNDGYWAFTAGTEYAGSITADPGNYIRGYLVTAVDPSGDRIGTFIAGAGQRFLDCSGVNSVPAAATLVHSTPNTAASVPFRWTAPSGNNSMVKFRFTIVPSQSIYFGPLTAPMPIVITTPLPHTDINPIRVFSECPSAEAIGEVMEDTIMGLASDYGVNVLGLLQSFPGSSCEEILSVHPGGSGSLYWINNNNNNNTHQEHCY